MQEDDGVELGVSQARMQNDDAIVELEDKSFVKLLGNGCFLESRFGLSLKHPHPHSIVLS